MAHVGWKSPQGTKDNYLQINYKLSGQMNRRKVTREEGDLMLEEIKRDDCFIVLEQGFIDQIKNMYKDGLTYSDIQRYFGKTYSKHVTLLQIAHYSRWNGLNVNPFGETLEPAAIKDKDQSNYEKHTQKFIKKIAPKAKAKNLTKMTAEIAKEFKVSARSVANWRNQGMPFNDDLSFDVQEITDWLDKSAKKGRKKLIKQMKIPKHWKKIPTLNLPPVPEAFKSISLENKEPRVGQIKYIVEEDIINYLIVDRADKSKFIEISIVSGEVVVNRCKGLDLCVIKKVTTEDIG